MIDTIIKKASLVVPKHMQNNNIFQTNQHMHDLLDSWNMLKKEFKKHNYDLSTDDINLIQDSDIVIYANDMPKKLNKKHNCNNSYILLYESAFIKPRNFNKKFHRNFNKIFTWDDTLVDDKKYIKINYTYKFPSSINKDIYNRKLCVLISANKIYPHTKKNDLYSKRIEAIRWFEQNHLNDFDLYGIGWDKYKFHGIISRVLNNISFIRDTYSFLTNKKYISYKGKIDKKKEVMEKYKFSICYENVQNITGYISEKIFDSFFAGCIPVYLGADNISDHIPKECLIDKRDFLTYEELYDFLSNMSDKICMEYLNSIEKFLNSKESYKFTSECFAETIVRSTIK